MTVLYAASQQDTGHLWDVPAGKSPGTPVRAILMMYACAVTQAVAALRSACGHYDNAFGISRKPSPGGRHEACFPRRTHRGDRGKGPKQRLAESPH